MPVPPPPPIPMKPIHGSSAAVHLSAGNGVSDQSPHESAAPELHGIALKEDNADPGLINIGDGFNEGDGN